MPGRLGVTPIPSAELVDDHAAVLLSWIRAGRRNAEVVHLGESCGLSLLPKDTEERLRAAIKAGATDALFAPGEQGGDRRGLSSSYLAAAARFGVLRRIYWVLPTRDLEHTNAELRIRYLIERTVPGISRAELDDLHLQKGCVRGRVSGIDLAVCSVETASADAGSCAHDHRFLLRPDYADAWINRGWILVELGRDAEAVDSYDKGLAINPDDASAWFIRGAELGILGRPEEALASFDKAIAINPNDAYAWNFRGVALHELGRYAEAVGSYDKAIAINPDYAEVKLNRNLALKKLT